MKKRCPRITRINTNYLIFFSCFSCVSWIIFILEKKPGRFSPPGPLLVNGLQNHLRSYDQASNAVSGIRSFDVERGIIGQGGMGDVGYRNGKGTGGFDAGRCKAHGATGTGNA